MVQATLEIEPQKPPILEDKDGVFRVSETRVRLDTVIVAYQYGCHAEEILLKYPSLNSPDIHSVISYYLKHVEEVDAYIAERRNLIDEAEQEIEVRFPSAGIRERLLARREIKN